MAQVNVYEPWDVAVKDTAARWAERLVPTSRPLRVAFGAGALSVATALSILCVWIGAHLDAVFFVGSIVRNRVRDAVLQDLGLLFGALFGPQSVSAVQHGGPAMLFALLATMVALVALVTIAVRTVVSSSRRGRA
jgi:hypothetical protein